MMSTRARGMVNKQSRISEIARFAMKTFLVVIISWIYWLLVFSYYHHQLEEDIQDGQVRTFAMNTFLVVIMNQLKMWLQHIWLDNWFIESGPCITFEEKTWIRGSWLIGQGSNPYPNSKTWLVAKLFFWTSVKASQTFQPALDWVEYLSFWNVFWASF